MNEETEPPIGVPNTKNMTENRIAYSQWLKRGTNTYLPADNSVTKEQIEAGVYDIKHSQDVGYYLFKKELNLDELIELPSVEGAKIIAGMETFWARKDKFIEYGYTYKRGIMLYGVPGGGKSSIINLLCKKLIQEKNGVIFTLNSQDDLHYYLNFMPEIYRMIEPDRSVITIIEDLDGLCQNKEVESKLLNVLDGIEQLQNVVYLATTNYTEKLSERILNRPNRFDIRIEVKSPNAECRKIYFQKKLKVEDLKKINMEEWIKKTEGLTMAHLGEIIKSVIILGEDFEETMERLGGMKQIPQSRNYNAEFEKKIGF